LALVGNVAHHARQEFQALGQRSFN
jgi:hypothetical protein